MSDERVKAALLSKQTRERESYFPMHSSFLFFIFSEKTYFGGVGVTINYLHAVEIHFFHTENVTNTNTSVSVQDQTPLRET
jgi:hypothetical protein|tara:strand:+ start:79 stop:321 length:243 start_codon:yes stop_codon:yes gene_type:complete